MKNLRNPATCAVAVGFAVTGALVAGPFSVVGVAGGLLSNLASHHLEDVTGPLWNQTCQRYFDRRDSLDPAIKGAYKAAFVSAVTQVEKRWFTEHHRGRQQRLEKIDGPAKVVFEQLRTDAGCFLDDSWLRALDDDVDAIRSARETGIPESQIFAQSLAALLAHEDWQLQGYIPSELPPAIRACFEAELKHNEKARTAYQFLMYSQILSNQAAIRAGLSVQSAEHRELIARWDELIAAVQDAHDGLATQLREIQGTLSDVVKLLSDQLHSSARVKPVSELTVRLGGDILVPAWRADIHLGRECEENARRALNEHRAVILRGRPHSGKTHIAARLLLDHPDAVVIMPTKNEAPQIGDIPGDQEVILYLDDLQVYADTRSYEDWMKVQEGNAQ